MKYLVSQIIKSEPVEGKFGPQIRTSFKVADDEQDRTLSCFSKFPLKEGQEVDGTITPNGQWWNFKFTPKTFETKPSPSFQPQGDLFRTEVKLDQVLSGLRTIGGEITAMKSVLADILQKVAPIGNEPPF